MEDIKKDTFIWVSFFSLYISLGGQFFCFIFISIHDSVDWKEKGAQEEYYRVIKNVKSGSIVLFHNNAKYTPENLPKILEKLKAEGYKIVPISELIYMDNYELDHTGNQIRNNGETDKKSNIKTSEDNSGIKENKK